MHEAQMHKRNSFLTLTYDDEHLPSDGSLQVLDWQYFAKRLRKFIVKSNRDHMRGRPSYFGANQAGFRYFHCGEYGDHLGRPHYHAALFGLDFHQDRINYKTTKTGNPLFNSPALDHLWGKGFAVIGQLTFNSAAYVARYCLKKVTGKKADAHYGGLKPEYTTMSRRPGLGSTWFAQYVDDVYPSDQVITNGRPARPPKYYDSQYEILSGDLEALKRKRASMARKNRHDQTPERLQVRETVTKARLNQLRRT